MSPDYERIERSFRARPGTGTLVGRVALEGRTVQIVDAWTDPLYEIKADARVGDIRTMLGVPLMRDGGRSGSSRSHASGSSRSPNARSNLSAHSPIRR